MPILSAENAFRQGLEALVDNNYVEAGSHFRRAIHIETQRHVRHPDMRYVSYYGLCLAKAQRRFPEAIAACGRAAARRSRDPKMFLNLGRVYLAYGEIGLAAEAFAKGLRLDPACPALSAEKRRAEGRLRGGGGFFPHLGRLFGRRRSNGGGGRWTDRAVTTAR